MTAPNFKGNLVGINFRPAEVRELIKALSVGDSLTLERDPLNPYDENAVKVFYEGDLSDLEFLGFIERGIAASLARWMDEGWLYTATIHSPTEDKRAPWLIEITATGERVEPEDEGLKSEWEDTDEDEEVGFTDPTEPKDDIPY